MFAWFKLRRSALWLAVLSLVLPLLLVLGAAAQKPQTEARVSPQEAKKLLALVDDLAKFASEESGLPLKGSIQRQIISRSTIENYLRQKFDEDEGARRLQRGEIVLKKFGLLDPGFALKPFLLDLLKEQVEAYYDVHEKTVFLLDWVGVEEQKPVLAHELTHALQDQKVDLAKWSGASPDTMTTTATADNELLAGDEMDTARDAVVEGQATAVMVNYSLRPMGRSLAGDPEVLGLMMEQMANEDSSPVLARAPRMIAESLLFPYREGLRFEQALWIAQGRSAAFAGALDRPPRSTWEVYNPREYLQRHTPIIPLLPDVHPLLDKLYKPYDLGQIGQLDLHILTAVYGGDEASAQLTPAWDGGVYWAGLKLDAQGKPLPPTTGSVAMFYLSSWKSAEAARAFANLYADALGRMASSVEPPEDKGPGAVLATAEGPVLIEQRGRQVFVSQSFELPLARQLAALAFDVQGSGEWKLAAAQPTPGSSLAGSLSRFLSNCGAMKFAVQAAVAASR